MTTEEKLTDRDMEWHLHRLRFAPVPEVAIIASTVKGMLKAGDVTALKQLIDLSNHATAISKSEVRRISAMMVIGGQVQE